MINLTPVSEISDSIQILYMLLSERTKDQSISHQSMPSFVEHSSFVESNPYLAWYLIYDHAEVVGSIYLTKQREVGISIFNHFQGRGLGKEAIKLLMHRHPGKFLANINPNNEVSIKFFNKLGFKHIQNTYVL
jgi:RimJ/RimL family protein N-acetyltransferase